MSLFAELQRRNVIRVAIAYVAAAWLIIQVVETLFPIYGLSDGHVRLVVTLLAIGFPLVVVFSWLYELTPEGLKLDRDVDRTKPIAGHTGKNLDRLIIATLALAVGYFAVDKFVLDPARDAEREEVVAAHARSNALVESYGANSIAVLPFENLSADPDDEFFSDGIAEELLNLLSRVPELRVISRSSSFSFKGKDFTLPELSEKLNVALVLEGSVRRFGNDLRITAQLIDARADTHLWSQTYDRKMANLFAVQDEISAAIVDALRNQLSVSVAEAPTVATTTTSEAYDAYLRGRYLVEQRTPDARRAAVEEFTRAVELDPDYAPAHAELAIAIAIGGLGDVPHEEFMRKLAQHAEAALRLDPDLAEAHAALGWLWDRRNQEQKALAEFRRAVELKPSYAIAQVWLAGYATDLDERFRMGEAALRLDPLSRSANFGFINGLIARGRIDEAKRHIDKLASFEPGGATVLRGTIAAIGGHWSQWLLAYLEAAHTDPGKLVFGWGLEFGFNWQLAAIGLRDEALRRAGDIPQVQAWFGDPEEGVALAEKQYADDGSANAILVTGMVLAHAGHFDRARPQLEKYWALTGERFATNWALHAQIFDAMVAMRRAAGDEDGAVELITAMNASVRRHRDAGMTLTQMDRSVDYNDGLAAYLSGDRDRGLALIAKAVDDGFWIPPMSAFQQDRFADPGFAEILAVNEARQARERARLLEVVCKENPYAAVWQPLPETCESRPGP